MKKVLGILVLCLALTGCKKHSNIQRLKDTFQATLMEKNFSAIPKYYHPELIVYTNSVKMDYLTYLETHRGMYAPSVHYMLEYSEPTFLEQGNKMAGRLWLTTLKDNEPPKKMEVVLIVEFKNDKIYRLWELTDPNWTKEKQ